MDKLEQINLVVLTWRFDTKINAEKYVDVVDSLIKAAKEEVFDDTFIEAGLCSCDVIQNLQVKDADKVLDTHKDNCGYRISKESHLKINLETKPVVRKGEDV